MWGRGSAEAQFASFFERQREAARARGVPETFWPEVVGWQETRADVAILYVHGFGAGPAEGHSALARLSECAGVPVYFHLLAGHGADPDAHASVRPAELQASVLDAAVHTRSLGHRLIVVGTSMGAALATTLAADHPELVDGLVLVSPFYAFGDGRTWMLNIPGFAAMMDLLEPQGRSADPRSDRDGAHRIGPGYDAHWLMRQRYVSLLWLRDLAAEARRADVLRRVRCPILMLVYRGSGEAEDRVASIPAMLRAWGLMPGASLEGSRIDYVADGHHVLLSEHVRVDHARVADSLARFVENVRLRGGVVSAGAVQDNR